MTAQAMYALAEFGKLGFELGQSLFGNTPPPAPPTCQDCGREPPPSDGVRLNCCGRIVCPSCVRDYLTPMAGGRLLVECRCGTTRVVS